MKQFIHTNLCPQQPCKIGTILSPFYRWENFSQLAPGYTANRWSRQNMIPHTLVPEPEFLTASTTQFYKDNSMTESLQHCLSHRIAHHILWARSGVREKRELLEAVSEDKEAGNTNDIQLGRFLKKVSFSGTIFQRTSGNARAFLVVTRNGGVLPEC